MASARFAGRQISAVLFDLDGTLADTAPDLANALNYTLNLYDRPSLSLDEIRPTVTYGGLALIQLGFKTLPAQTSMDDLRHILLDFYQQNLRVDTQLFEGMPEVLATLEAKEMAWGIVTNKPSWLTDPLMEQLSLTQRAGCIVSGDTTPHSKPHPAPLIYASKQLRCDPQNCVFIGDAITDIEAGKNANMATMTALFGYINAADQAEHWGSDVLLAQPLDILPALNLIPS